MCQTKLSKITDIWISWKSSEISHSLAIMLYLVPGYMGGSRCVRELCLLKQKIKQFIRDKIKIMDNQAIPNQKTKKLTSNLSLQERQIL